MKQADVRYFPSVARGWIVGLMLALLAAPSVAGPVSPSATEVDQSWLSRARALTKSRYHAHAVRSSQDVIRVSLGSGWVGSTDRRENEYLRERQVYNTQR